MNKLKQENLEDFFDSFGKNYSNIDAPNIAPRDNMNRATLNNPIQLTPFLKNNLTSSISRE